MSDKELKLIVAGQCMAGILANNSDYLSNETDERIAKWAWDVATELVKLSEQEEEKK